MKKRVIKPALFLLIISAGCASSVHVEKSPEANLANYRSWEWIETKANQSEKRNTSVFAEDAMHKAVAEELAKKGWREVTYKPDVLVTHEIAIQTENERGSKPVYKQSETRTHWNRRTGAETTVTYPPRYSGEKSYTIKVREGTITFTLLDAKTDKALWQGWTTETLDQSKITSEELEKITHRIWKKL